LEWITNCPNIFVLGFERPNISRKESGRMIYEVTKIRETFGERARILCIVPKNGKFRDRLISCGADFVINATDPESTKIIRAVGDPLQLLVEDIEGTARLETPIIVTKRTRELYLGNNQWSREGAIEGMAAFTLQERKRGDGSTSKLRLYATHMAALHDPAKDLVRSRTVKACTRMEESVPGSVDIPDLRVLEIGSGHGHASRHVLRKIALTGLVDGPLQSMFWVGLDRDKDMVKIAEEEYLDKVVVPRLNDYKKGRISPDQFFIPGSVDLSYKHVDFMDFSPDELIEMKFGRGLSIRKIRDMAREMNIEPERINDLVEKIHSPSVQFGLPNVVVVEYVGGHWVYDRPAFIEHIKSFIEPGAIVIPMEEYPLKISTGPGMTKKVALGIINGTCPTDSFGEYLEFWYEAGFAPILDKSENPLIVTQQIDGPEVPSHLIHHVFSLPLVYLGK